ncbi:unnamed protein product [Ceratitis capitata]|uniref:(Mediterranean fruit fly) hypothetical protein n=1 Tax=Ceratitis capitata TaxID=7213 RepID=A0A811U1N4_CERCA|nr:unnamed protein product [Ceratitis capitata]
MYLLPIRKSAKEQQCKHGRAIETPCDDPNATEWLSEHNNSSNNNNNNNNGNACLPQGNTLTHCNPINVGVKIRRQQQNNDKRKRSHLNGSSCPPVKAGVNRTSHLAMPQPTTGESPASE